MGHFRDHHCLGFLLYSIFQLVILMIFTDYIHAFNIDVSSPIVYRGSPESYFGFAVELHREGNQNMILVGAPRAQTEQPGVHRGGAVFKCPVNTQREEPISSPTSSSSSSLPDAFQSSSTELSSSSSEVPLNAREIASSMASPESAAVSPDTTSSSSCQQISFDTSGNEFVEGDQITNKSGQMLGATIKSSGPDGTVLVCRPLYTWFYYVNSHPDTRRFPVGGCFFARDNFTQVTPFNPCITTDSSRVKFLRCVLGLSAAISETEWIIGAVGAFYAQGELLVGNFSSSTYHAYRRSEVIDDITYDFTYGGSSVAFGDFFGDGEVEYVTGVPRGAIHHRGSVEFRDRDLRNYLIINGHQIGAYFGHALVVADFNDDGYDDIVISAPMYSAYNVPISDGWEVGRIYVYYNNRQGAFPVSHTISGEWPGGRFGYTMTSLSDINRDGYIDLAVSAPYFGDDKEGRVSIYLSSGSRGLSPTPSQHISPSMFGMRMTSFGFSLAGRLDVDNNTYPDLVVGSYLSSKVVLFRSRPVVDLNVTLTLNGMKGINLDERTLLLQDGSHVARFNLSLCMLYTGVALPEQLNVSYTLSSIDQTPPRSKLLLPDWDEESFSQISRDIPRCVHLTGFIMKSIRDKLTPIRYRVDYAIASNQDSYGGKLAPILDSKIEPHKELLIPFIYDCNSTICVPDFSITVSSDISVIVVGAPAMIHLNLSISNHGEDAYESVLNFTQPNNFQFVQVIQLTKNNRLITCDKKAGRTDLVCDLGNPVKAHEQIVIQLVFATATVEGDFNNVSFVMEASSTHNDSTPINNRASIGVNVTVKSELSFEGGSENEYLLYDMLNNENNNASMTDDEPNMIHRYVLRNKGPSDIGRTSVLIHFPHSISDSTTEHDIIELIDAEVEGGDKCDVGKVVTNEIISTPASSDDDSSLHSSISPSPHQPSTLSPTNTPTRPVFGGRSPARRRKRRADIGVTNNMTENDYDYISFEGNLPVIDCSDGTVCYEITCHIDTLGTRKTSFRDSAAIIVTSRFNVDLFLQLSPELNTTSLAVVSHANVLVYGSEYNVQLPLNITLSAMATTRVVALQQVIEDNGSDSNPYQPTPIPKTSIWLIIGACLMGVAILAGTNGVLYKMGFFKRQRIGLEDKVPLRKKPDRMSLRQRSVIFDED